MGSTSSSTPAPQFVTAQASEIQPNTLQQIAAVDTYIAQYIDGEGHEQVRICFTVPGSDAVFVLNEMIGGQRLATTSHGWFKTQFIPMLSRLLTGADEHGEGVGSI